MIKEIDKNFVKVQDGNHTMRKYITAHTDSSVKSSEEYEGLEER